MVALRTFAVLLIALSRQTVQALQPRGGSSLNTITNRVDAGDSKQDVIRQKAVVQDSAGQEAIALPLPRLGRVNFPARVKLGLAPVTHSVDFPSRPMQVVTCRILTTSHTPRQDNPPSLHSTLIAFTSNHSLMLLSPSTPPIIPP
jgi:hypothetical protein